MSEFPDRPIATASAPPGFELQRLIGRGASGRVFQARQHSTSRLVALKVLDVDPASTDAGARFERECAVMGELGGHPNIVTVYDAGRHEGQPWIAMELCQAGSLADRLVGQDPMSVPDAVSVLTKIAGALHTAHQKGVLHCDVKPANIMITEFGEPALGDFGIARLVGGRTRLSTIGGGFTLDHAPPEALNGDASTAAADVYSLGTTIWQLLEGRSPFSRASDSGVGAVITRILSEPLPPLTRTDLPDQLHDLLLAMTAKDPVARPADLSEVAQRAAAIDVGGRSASIPTGGLAAAGVLGVGMAEFATEQGPGGASAANVGLDELATERAPGRASLDDTNLAEMATGRLPIGTGMGSDALTTARVGADQAPRPPGGDPAPNDLHYVGWGAAATPGEPGLTRARVGSGRPPPGRSAGRSAGVAGWFGRPAVRITAIALVVAVLLAGAAVAVWWTMSPQPGTAADQQGIGQAGGQQPGQPLPGQQPGQPAPGQPGAPAAPGLAGPGAPQPGAPDGAAPPAPQPGEAPAAPPADGSSDNSGPSGTSTSGTHTLAQRLGPNCDRPDYWQVSGPTKIDVSPDGAVTGTMEGHGQGRVQATCDGVSGTINWNVTYKITFTGRVGNGQFTGTGSMANIDRSTASGCTRGGAPVECPPNVEAGARKYSATVSGRLDRAGAGSGAIKVDMARPTGGTWTAR